MTKQRMQSTWERRDIGGAMAYFPTSLVKGVKGSYSGDPTKGEPCTMEVECDAKTLAEILKRGATKLPEDIKESEAVDGLSSPAKYDDAEPHLQDVSDGHPDTRDGKDSHGASK